MPPVICNPAPSYGGFKSPLTSLPLVPFLYPHLICTSLALISVQVQKEKQWFSSDLSVQDKQNKVLRNHSNSKIETQATETYVPPVDGLRQRSRPSSALSGTNC